MKITHSLECFTNLAFVPIQNISPFSSKSRWCIKVMPLQFGSDNFLTKVKLVRS